MKSKKILFTLIASIFISASLTSTVMAVPNCLCGSTRTAWCNGYVRSEWTNHWTGFFQICEFVAGIHSVSIYCHNSSCAEPTVYKEHINMEFGHTKCGKDNFTGSCSGGDISSWY